MSARPGARIAAAVVTGLLSLGVALYSGAIEQQRAVLLAAHRTAQLAPIPAGLVPPGTAVPPPLPPLGPTQRHALAGGLWRNPLDASLFNLLYADDLRAGAPVGSTEREAALLSRLGWRFIPAQQNLVIRAATADRFGEVVDHADALLRRQAQPALSYAVLQIVESHPEMHGYLVAKLRGAPPWRRDYLSVIGAQSPPALLNGRIATLAALMSGGALSREDIGPSLAALAGSGHARAAYALWARHAGMPRTGELVYDPDFRRAALLAGAGPAIPFEWKFGQDIGYAAQPSSGGATIDWDRQGVPLFLSQTVPVQPGHGYVLTIRGSDGAGGSLARLLTPAIGCGGSSVAPARGQDGNGQIRYLFAPLPASCDMGLLSISGAVDAGVGDATLTITGISLRPLA